MSIRWRYLGEVLICGFLVDAAIYAGAYLWPIVGQILGRPAATTPASDPSNTVRVMFFPEEKIPCRQHYEQYVPDGKSECPHGNECQFSHEAPQLDILFRSLLGVKSYLDVCVYMITSYELSCAIIAVHERGVRVRIIVDGNCCDDSKSQIGRFRAKGIPVRSNKPGFLMHHKFLILDGRLLINGSFNWTWQAITGNSENLMMTGNPALVKPYIGEFDRLWNKYDPSLK